MVTINNPLSIAIVPPFNIGDGLLYLIIANNLVKNGFDVTIYHNPVSQLQSYLPYIKVKPTPKTRETFESALASYDIVISDVSNVLTKDQPSEVVKDLANRYVFTSASKFREMHQGKLNYSHPQLQIIAQAAGKIYDGHDDKASMVEHFVRFCKTKLKLNNVTSDTGLHAPNHLKFQKHNKRVVIHPTSTAIKKNWYPRNFIHLARRLKQKGYEVAFTVAPNERDAWLEHTQGEFTVPLTQTIGDLADYIYESRALIGNDSGNGHLASALGVPVLSIFGRTKGHNFRWRPGWGYNLQARPAFTFKPWRRERIWKPFLPVSRVYDSFQQLIKETKV